MQYKKKGFKSVSLEKYQSSLAIDLIEHSFSLSFHKAQRSSRHIEAAAFLPGIKGHIGRTDIFIGNLFFIICFLNFMRERDLEALEVKPIYLKIVYLKIPNLKKLDNLIKL